MFDDTKIWNANTHLQNTTHVFAKAQTAAHPATLTPKNRPNHDSEAYKHTPWASIHTHNNTHTPKPLILWNYTVTHTQGKVWYFSQLANRPKTRGISCKQNGGSVYTIDLIFGPKSFLSSSRRLASRPFLSRVSNILSSLSFTAS